MRSGPRQSPVKPAWSHLWVALASIAIGAAAQYLGVTPITGTNAGLLPSLCAYPRELGAHIK